MPTILITGANRGLGLGFARHYAAQGWRVIATCRHPADAVHLNDIEGNVRVLGLDMESDSDIAALSDSLADEPIHLLLLNAGIFNPDASLGHLKRQPWGHMMNVNCIGPALVADALRAHLTRAAPSWIVGMTSGLGSIGGNTNGSHYYYRATKAAFNMAMRNLAIDFKPSGVGAVAIHPGWVKTDMGGPNAPTSIAESIASMTAVIAKLSLDDSGKFFSPDGGECPW